MGLKRVADRSRGAMGIHISDYVGSNARIPHRVAHHPEATFMFRRRLRHVISIAAHSISRDLSQDASVALAGVLQLFQDQNARAFANHKTVAVAIPRTAGLFRCVVARRKGAHGGKAADAHGRDRSFRAAGNHHIRVVVLDNAERISNGMSAGGTGRRGRFVRSLGAETHGDLPSRKIDNGRRNKEGRNLARTAFHQRGVLAFDDVEPSDPRSDVNSHALIVLRGNLELRHLDRFIGGGNRHVNEASHLLDFFFFDEIQRVEALHLGGNLAGKSCGIETGNASHSALTRKQGLPHHVGGIAHTTDQAQACHYDPASQLFPRFRVLADIVDRVLDGANLLGILVGDFDVERFLESHDQFDGVK